MYRLSPWMAKCNKRSSTTMGPLAIGMGINVSAYCSLSEVLWLVASAKACLDRSLLQLSYQQCRLECTTPSKITKTGVEMYLKLVRDALQSQSSIQSHKLTVLHPFSTHFELNPR